MRFRRIKRHGLFVAHRDFMEPVGRFEEFAGTWTIGSADQAVTLHEIDQMRGTSVADAQPPLKEGRGGLAELEDETNRIVKHGIVFIGVFILAFDGGAFVLG